MSAIGARADVIEKAESRELFREAMEKIGLKMPASGIARTIEEARQLGSVLPSADHPPGLLHLAARAAA